MPIMIRDVTANPIPESSTVQITQKTTVECLLIQMSELPSLALSRPHRVSLLVKALQGRIDNLISKALLAQLGSQRPCPTGTKGLPIFHPKPCEIDIVHEFGPPKSGKNILYDLVIHLLFSKMLLYLPLAARAK